MRLFVLDTEGGMGLDLALRIIEHDHEVRYFCDGRHPVGEGFPGLKKVADWKDGMAWVGKDGLVFPTGNSKYVRDLDRYRELGFRIFGPTVQSAALEIDRQKGMEAMQAAGLSVPAYHMLDSLQAAQAFAKRHDEAFVFKPMGSEGDKALTYVSDSPADMVGWLQRQIDRGMVLKGQCMLQEKIEMCAEFGVSGWMGPEGFIPDCYHECHEFKKLMPGDIGPATGEQGTVCQYVERSRLFDETLKPLEPILRTMGHRGDFAIGVGIDEQGRVCPFEFTARAGWPARFIQDASHKGDPLKWMSDLMDGKASLRYDPRPAVGVVMAQPPYPEFDGRADLVEGKPIFGLDEVWDQAHPAMMMMGRGPAMEGGKVRQAPQYQTAGELVCVMTGLGATVSKAAKACYAAVEQVKFSDCLYRNDIGRRLEDCLPELHAHGYALETDYE